MAFKNGEIRMYFPSTEEAGRKGFHSSHIAYCCKGKLYKHHKGYQWKYLDDVLGDWLEEIQDEDMKNERVLN